MEADADGSITVTGGFTPRHPDWTGLSPLWENAPNTQPMILADRTLQGQPGLVLMHTEEAARLLIEPDDMPLEIIPEGTASHLAGILRHHGARSVRWKSVAEQDGVAGPTDPYTWSSWHYQIPAELMTPPEGWTLSRNLLHTWMIQDVGQALTLAMYAVNNAEAAVNMAEQAQNENRGQAAEGGVLAAQLMADRAQTCFDQAVGLIRQGAPHGQSTAELERLAERIRITRRQTQAPPPPRKGRAQRWYADACHRLLRHKSCTTMVPQMLDAITLARNDYQRYLMTSTCQQICAWPSDNIYEIPEEYPIGGEPDPELASTVRLCDEEMNALYARTLAPMNDAALTEFSPGLEPYPELMNRLRHTLLPAVGCDCGFEYAALNTEVRELGISHASVGWTGFSWEGRRIFKAAAEAYPAGYPAPLAKGHAIQLEMRFAALVSDDPDADYNRNLQPFYIMYSAIKGAADSGWHTITGPQMERLAKAFRAEGLSDEDAKSMIAVLTGNNQDLIDYLTYNSNTDTDTLFMIPGREPRRRLQLSKERAGRLRAAALAAGFPANYAELITAA